MQKYKEVLKTQEQELKEIKKQINNQLKDAISKGALGGKLLGAGGGGFFVFYVPVSKQKKFIQHFKNLVHIPFNFTNAGSKIILNNYN